MSQFSRKHASAILGKLSDTPEAANTLMKRLRLLLNYAVDIGMIPSNQMAGMKGYKTDAEVHRYTAKADQVRLAHSAFDKLQDTANNPSC